MNKKTFFGIFSCLLFFISEVECQVITIYNTQNSALPFNTVRCLEIQNNIIWAGTDVGLAKLENEQWEVYTSLNSPLFNDDIRSIKSDGDSLIWIGTVSGGLFSFNGTQWNNFNVSNSGLLDNLIRDINIDQNDNIWLATTEGLCMYDRTSWHHWNMQDNNLLTNNITSVQIGTNNEKYVGTINGGILYFDSLNQFNEYTIINSNLPDNSVVAIEIDQNGQPWFLSPAAGLVTDTDTGGPWTNYNNLNSGLPTNALNCLQFLDNELIIGSEVSGLIFKDNDLWQYINTSNSDLPDDHILAIKIDDSQNIWAGTFNEGLCKINLQNKTEEVQQRTFMFYPNQIHSGQHITFKNQFTGRIQLFNGLGALICSQQIVNENQWMIPTKINRGLYRIKLSIQGDLFTDQLVVY